MSGLSWHNRLMGRWKGERSGIAAVLIVVTAAGLSVALVVAGLNAAAEIASFVFLGPLTVGVIRWARPEGMDQSGGKGVRAPAATPASRTGQRNILLIPGFTFSTPIPWNSLLAVSFLTYFGVSGVWTLTYPGKVTEILGSVFLAAAVIGITGILAGEFGPSARAILDPRPKLVVSQSGIYYRWDAKRALEFPWDNIVRIRAGLRDGRAGDEYEEADYLVLVLAVGTGSRRADRNIVLCLLGEPGFPRDEIRGAIASFMPSLLDRSL
jgi:hypothetical protein